MHFRNGRFSNRETGFSGPCVVWCLLGTPGVATPPIVRVQSDAFLSVFQDLQSPLSEEKKLQALFFSRKKYIWRGVNINGAFNNLKVPVDLAFQADSGFNVALRVQRRAALAAKVATNASSPVNLG